jgi:hypothetical protein
MVYDCIGRELALGDVVTWSARQAPRERELPLGVIVKIDGTKLSVQNLVGKTPPSANVPSHAAALLTSEYRGLTLEHISFMMHDTFMEHGASSTTRRWAGLKGRY